MIRPWEWKVLEGIRLDDAALVHEAALDPAMDWNVTVGEQYGHPRDLAHLYYLVMSFDQLTWRVGDTMLETTLLNHRKGAAMAIPSCMRKFFRGEGAFTMMSILLRLLQNMRLGWKSIWLALGVENTGID